MTLLGRWGPLFRDAERCPLPRQVRLALARAAAAQTALCPDGGKSQTRPLTARRARISCSTRSGVVGAA
eukprot:497388-Pyramimonas_sp.AAC.1